ncbi:MAG: DUF3592 domain-containing protein [Anaerolineae bacterium]
MDSLFNLDGFGSIIGIVVIIPFVVIALIFLFVGIRGRSKAAIARRTWQNTQGRVLFSDVEGRQSSDSEGGWSVSYYPRVVYEYAVNGARFQGRRVVLGSEIGLGNYNAVERKVHERYPVGATVQVYYNPNEPREAALELSAPANNVYLIIAAVILVILIFTSAIMFGAQGVAGNVVNQILNGAVPAEASNGGK